MLSTQSCYPPPQVSSHQQDLSPRQEKACHSNGRDGCRKSGSYIPPYLILFVFWLLFEASGCVNLRFAWNILEPLCCANYAESSWQLGGDLFLILSWGCAAMCYRKQAAKTLGKTNQSMKIFHGPSRYSLNIGRHHRAIFP